MPKRVLIAVVAAVVLVGGIYWGSPYWALHGLRNAAREADADRIEAGVDFPAVRASLKTQLSAAMTERMAREPGMRDNPFAGLATMLAPAIVERMIDAIVTPQGIAAMLRGGTPRDGASAGDNPDVVVETGYVGLDRFRVRLRNRRTDSPGPSFLFERRGFAGWKMIAMELPVDALAIAPPT